MNRILKGGIVGFLFFSLFLFYFEVIDPFFVTANTNPLTGCYYLEELSAVGNILFQIFSFPENIAFSSEGVYFPSLNLYYLVTAIKFVLIGLLFGSIKFFKEYSLF